MMRRNNKANTGNRILDLSLWVQMLKPFSWATGRPRSSFAARAPYQVFKAGVPQSTQSGRSDGATMALTTWPVTAPGYDGGRWPSSPSNLPTWVSAGLEKAGSQRRAAATWSKVSSTWATIPPVGEGFWELARSGEVAWITKSSRQKAFTLRLMLATRV